MINVLLPIAGRAKRFLDLGYNLPKPLIAVGGVPMIKKALESLFGDDDPKDYKLIFVVRDDHCATFDIQDTLRNLFADWQTEFAVVDQITQGTLCSCLIARHLIDLDEPLVIYTPDVCFDCDLDLKRQFADPNRDGFLLTFKANSTDHSYVATDANGFATRTAEKVVISNDAMVGVYGFKTGAMFLDCADRAIADKLMVNNEFYVAPIYNYLINDGKRVTTHRTEKMYVLGTPEDLVFYESHVVRYDPITKFLICCDHSGFETKTKLLRVLKDLVDVDDFGAYSTRDSDHYDSLKPCIDSLLNSSNAVGVGICCTGQGYNIAANKVKGVRSVLVSDEYTAMMGRRHNAANFFSIASRSVASEEVLYDIVTAILNNTFDGGRHATRIRKIANDPAFIG